MSLKRGFHLTQRTQRSQRMQESKVRNSNKTHDLDLLASRDVIGHVTVGLATYGFL